MKRDRVKLFFWLMASPIQMAGWKKASEYTAAAINTGSIPMNRYCLNVIGPVQPWLSSATLYAQRHRTNTIARARATVKPLKCHESRMRFRAGSCGSTAAAPSWRFLRRKRTMKSAHRPMNTTRVKTWNAKPAIMMLSPVVSDSLSWRAMDAIIPPAAWRTNDRISQGINYPDRLGCIDWNNQVVLTSLVYHFAGTREFSSP